MGKKDKGLKKVSAKKEKYAKFEAGKDDRIASRTRVPDRIVPQEFINANDVQISTQMRKMRRNPEPDDKKHK
jgi:hypothetical protein